MKYDRHQPLEVADQLFKCLTDAPESDVVTVPRWAAQSAANLLLTFMEQHRSPGRNSSYASRAQMDATHRLRYDMVCLARRLRMRFVGRFVFQAAAILCDDGQEATGPSPKAIERSYERVRKDPTIGEIAIRYIRAEPQSLAEIVAIQKKHARRLKELFRKQQSTTQD